MPFTDNPNILFQLSGVTQGNFVFTQNPETYDILAPKTLVNVLQILKGANIYQRGLLDNEVRTMSWSFADYSLWSGLNNYCQRDSNGNIIPSYFSDGTVKEFQGTLIEVLDVYGQPLQGYTDKWGIKLQFKPITQFDQEKLING